MERKMETEKWMNDWKKKVKPWNHVFAECKKGNSFFLKIENKNIPNVA